MVAIFSGAAQAAIIGIGTPSSSFASIQFNDTTSVNPSAQPGVTNYTTTSPGWNGSSFTMPTQTDPVTFDQATGNLLGQIINQTTYAVSLNGVTLTQLAVNTGYAKLNLSFDIQYVLDAGGLASQATLFPTFNVNGTVQPASTGFAEFGGTIDYYGTSTSGTFGLIDTVTYGTTGGTPYVWNTPGPFSATVTGVPVVGTTPMLQGNTDLYLVGNFMFTVDPATINIATVPEPATMCMLGLGGLLLHRKRSKT